MVAKIFSHEKLRVYQAAIEFISWLQKIVDKIPKSSSVYGQLDRASTSIPLNIAEGNGKRTQLDRCKFFYISRGSAFECAAALDVLVAKTILAQEEIVEGKEILLKIVSMLVKLIESNMNDTIREEISEYGWDAVPPES